MKPMLSLSCITLFPELYKTFFNTSIVGRACNSGIIKTPRIINLFDFVEPSKRIDSPIVGGGAGMLLGTDIIEKGMQEAYSQYQKKPFTIFLAPHGKKLDQVVAHELINTIINDHDGNVVTFAARYEGYDARVESEYADCVISIGDFITMGGDIPALALFEVLLRLLPGVVGKQESVEQDSFTRQLLDAPSFANPDIWHSKAIPTILKTGNHGLVEEWRYKDALYKTIIERFDWWRLWKTPFKERQEVKKNIIPNHYVVLMHNDVVLPHDIVGESSVTSIDIHDIARSSATYGLKGYYIVTRLAAQKAIVEKFLSFWDQGEGREYNKQRSFALSRTACMSELDEVLHDIKLRENGVEPIIIVTSSRREIPHDNFITFHDQKTVWEQKRPVVILLGTAHGLSTDIMNKAHYRLVPLEGFEEFNFLSVRSAAAIIFDRWLGINVKY